MVARSVVPVPGGGLFIPALGKTVAMFELFPFSRAFQLDENGCCPDLLLPYEVVLLGVAAMAEVEPQTVLELRVQGRVGAEFSLLHLAHLWPEPYVLTTGVAHPAWKYEDRAELKTYPPAPRAIVVLFGMMRRELR